MSRAPEPVGDRPGYAELQVLRCQRCWQLLGPDHRADEARPAVIVALGNSYCEEHARSTWRAVWS